MSYKVNDSGSEICRLCGENDNSTSDALKESGLVDLIYKYLSIQIVKGGTLPSNVCEYCKSKVETFDTFAVQCKLVQETLLSDKKLSVYSENDVTTPNDENEDDVKTVNAIKQEYPLDEYKEEDGDFDFCDEDILPLSECAANINSIELNKKTRKPKKSRSEKSTSKRKKVTSKRDVANSKKIKTKCKKETVSKKASKNENEDSDGIKAEEEFEEERRNGSDEDNAKKVDTIKYNCHECIEIFSDWYTLSKHVDSIHFVRPRVMCVCKKPLYSMEAINTHIRKHGEKTATYICELCNKVFLVKSNYERHVAKHSKLGSVDGLHECKECSLVLSSSKRYEQHMKKHKNKEDKSKTKCELCDRYYSTEQSLRYHKAAVHDKIKPYICDICGHAFNQRNNLESHRRVHSDRPVLHCEFCPRKFMNKRYLKRHMMCHSGVQYKCPMCPATFNYKNTLTNHMLIHQNLNKFICGFCNKGFKWQSSLKTHINIHTGATPYSCPWCSRTFSDRSNCRLHKKKYHARELAEYERKNGIVHLGRTMQFVKKNASVVPFKDPSKVKVLVYPKVDNIIDADD